MIRGFLTLVGSEDGQTRRGASFPWPCYVCGAGGGLRRGQVGLTAHSGQLVGSDGNEFSAAGRLSEVGPVACPPA